MQFTSLIANVGLIMMVVEKFIKIPLLFYKLSPLFVVCFVFLCNSIGRFMDKGELLDLEGEWSRQRDPLSQELRKKFKTRSKFGNFKR
ncbi:MAG: hypothetical protein CEN92_282 [Candidatus Berkelbacteria bacterium Licking1014_96]|uniref:Uncharacterized protein n=1 Tax=Candidatus Berkelbacteria bacterium Licking1014_96 TaxID=2017149 RepID=A0A554LF62_9BACT|nr:MAG: hypothetical protein CEN92_282 [Candidatus Berkelbacteria bacterium Licking1014_96]